MCGHLDSGMLYLFKMGTGIHTGGPSCQLLAGGEHVWAGGFPATGEIASRPTSASARGGGESRNGEECLPLGAHTIAA